MLWEFCQKVGLLLTGLTKSVDLVCLLCLVVAITPDTALRPRDSTLQITPLEILSYLSRNIHQAIYGLRLAAASRSSTLLSSSLCRAALLRHGPSSLCASGAPRCLECVRVYPSEEIPRRVKIPACGVKVAIDVYIYIYIYIYIWLSTRHLSIQVRDPAAEAREGSRFCHWRIDARYALIRAGRSASSPAPSEIPPSRTAGVGWTTPVEFHWKIC